MKKRILLLVIVALIAACTSQTDNVSPEIATPVRPTVTLAPEEPPEIDEPPTSTVEPTHTPTPSPTPTPTLVPLEAFQKGIAFNAWFPRVYAQPDTRWVIEEQIRDIGATWIEMAFDCYIEPEVSVEIDCRHEDIPTDEEIGHVVQVAHENGIRVMLKPQTGGSVDPSPYMNFGDVDQAEYWDAWFESYKKYISHYAKLAEELDVDMFCVGTELHGTTHFTDKWREVIAEASKVYSGPLTYAATWEEIEQDTVQFWNDLDYIGIDVYISISQVQHPTVEELVQDWQEPVARMEELVETWDKPVIFTEIGLPGAEGTITTLPEWGETNPVDLQTQANFYESVFQVFTPKSWWHGAFWWDWWPMHLQGGPYDNGWTARGKPAEDVLRHYYEGIPGSWQDAFVIPTPYPDGKSIVIFDEVISDTDFSIGVYDGSINQQVESVVHNGQYSLGVTLDNWGGFIIDYFSETNITEYDYLEFYINLGPEGGQELKLQVEYYPCPEAWCEGYESWTALGNYALVEQEAALPADEWFLVRIPIDKLFRAYQETAAEIMIMIQNFTQKPIPEFYLDEIRLVTAGS
jgi:hypothetical protein